MLKAFAIEYVALNPGSSYRGLHDSLANYGGNFMPEAILCPHEEIAVGVAHGYARAKARPMAAAVHDVVGLQHSCMAVYNAWRNRLPVIVQALPAPRTRRIPGRINAAKLAIKLTVKNLSPITCVNRKCDPFRGNNASSQFRFFGAGQSLSQEGLTPW